jgi:hypothetical protein
VTLHAGDSLWIPAKWWHWALSEPGTVLLDCWATRSVFNTVGVLPNTRYFPNVLQQLATYTGSVFVQRCGTAEESAALYKHFYNLRVNGAFVAAAEGSKNKALYRHVQDAILPPAVWTQNTSGHTEFVLRQYAGSHDAGLQYDNSCRLVTVLKGRQRLQIFAPDQSVYLRPLPVMPAWVQDAKALRMQYAIFRAGRPVLDAMPSARLLYESMCAGSEAFSEMLEKIIAQVGHDHVVFGVSATASAARAWELRFHHFSKHDYGHPAVAGMDTMLLAHTLPADVLMHAKEYVWQHDCLVAKESTTVMRGGALSYPFFGHGSTVLPGGRWQDPTQSYVLTPRLDMLARAQRYADRVSLPLSVATLNPLLRKYECQDLALCNTFDGRFTVQYLGISIADFVAFLHEFHYPGKLADHASKYQRQYADLIHEVAIVYSVTTLTPVSATFYGVV